jgi:hypothetical protein
MGFATVGFQNSQIDFESNSCEDKVGRKKSHFTSKEKLAKSNLFGKDYREGLQESKKKVTAVFQLNL